MPGGGTFTPSFSGKISLSCPAGKNVLGGGGVITFGAVPDPFDPAGGVSDGNREYVVITGSEPNFMGTGWQFHLLNPTLVARANVTARMTITCADTTPSP